MRWETCSLQPVGKPQARERTLQSVFELTRADRCPRGVHRPWRWQMCLWAPDAQTPAGGCPVKGILASDGHLDKASGNVSSTLVVSRSRTKALSPQGLLPLSNVRIHRSLLPELSQLPEVLRSCCFHFPSDGDLWSSCWVPGVGIAGIAEARPAPQGTPSRRLCCTAPGHICQSQRLNTSPNTRLLSGSTPKG